MSGTLVQTWSPGERCWPADHRHLVVSARHVTAMAVTLVHRPPATTAPIAETPGTGTPERLLDEHLLTDLSARDSDRIPKTDVAIVRAAGPASCEERVANVLRRAPGVLVVGVAPHVPADPWVIGVWGHGAISLITLCADPTVAPDLSWYVSLVHSWVVLGRPVAALRSARITATRTNGHQRCFRQARVEGGHLRAWPDC